MMTETWQLIHALGKKRWVSAIVINAPSCNKVTVYTNSVPYMKGLFYYRQKICKVAEKLGLQQPFTMTGGDDTIHLIWEDEKNDN